MSAFAAVGLSLLGLPTTASNQATGLPVAPAPVVNPIGDLVAAFFRRIQSVFDPYRTNQNASTTINPTTGQVTGSAQFTSPFFLPQWYTITAPAGGSATIDKNGQFVYTPTDATRHAAAVPGGVSTDSFTVTANNWISRSSVVVTVPILPADTAPTAGATTIGTPGANGVVAGSVSVTDKDGDPISYTASTPGKGSVVLSSTGGFTYTPTATARHDAASTGAPASAASDGFTITASDGHGGATPISVVVPILPTNQAPVAGTTTIGAPGANGVVTGIVSTTDADKDTVTYTAGTGTGAAPSHGTVVVTSTGGFTYTPSSTAQHAAAAGGVTADSFTVTADDGHGGVIPINVVVPIASANRAPVAGTTTLDPTAPNGFLGGTVTATDPDGDTVTFTGPATSSGGGTVQVSSSGQFIYQPSSSQQHAASAPGGAGTDSFTVTASDGHGGATPISVVVPILPADQAPVAGTTFVRTAGANGVVTGTVSATDPDGDTVTYVAGSGVSAQGGAVVVDSAGNFTYTPSAAAQHAAASTQSTAATSDSFTITASDGRGGSTPITVTVPIAPENVAPVAGTPSATVGSDATGLVTGSINATDADGDQLVYSGPTSGRTAGGGSITVSPNGTYSYTPTSAARHAAAAPGGVLSDTFLATVTDGHGGQTQLTVNVPIYSANQEPVVGKTTVNPADANGVVTGSVAITDPDGDPLTYTTTPATHGGVVVVDADGTFTYTPTVAAAHAAAAGGPTFDAFAITATDGHRGTTVPVTVVVPIIPQNQAPTAVSGTDGSTLVTVDRNTGVVSGTITVTDGDNDALTYVASTPGKGTVTVNPDGSFIYTPSAEARHAAALPSAPLSGGRSDSFTVTVTDGHGGSLPVTVSPPIVPSNAAPVVGTSTVGTPDATTGTVTGTLVATDADGDTLTWYQNGTPTGGSVTINSDGTFTYTPNAAARAAAATGGPTTDTISAVVADGYGGLTPVTASVPVSALAVNHSPVAGTTTVGTPGTGGVVTGSVTATDPDGDPLTYAGPTGTTATGGTVTVTPTGGFTYTPSSAAQHAASAPGGVASDSFTVAVTDGHGGSTPVTVTVPIAPTNTAPSGGSVTYGSVGLSGSIPVVVSATDTDGDTLSYTAGTQSVGGGTVSPTAGVVGGFTFSPRAQQPGTGAIALAATDSFTVTVTDGHGGSTPVVVHVPITTGGQGGLLVTVVDGVVTVVSSAPTPWAPIPTGPAGLPPANAGVDYTPPNLNLPPGSGSTTSGGSTMSPGGSGTLFCGGDKLYVDCIVR